MAIKGYGGLSIDSNNNREYPGAGGSIGGWSIGVRNIGYLAGAGDIYHSFTPAGGDQMDLILDNIPAPGEPGRPDPIPLPDPPIPIPDPIPDPISDPDPPIPGDPIPPNPGDPTDPGTVPAPPTTIGGIIQQILGTIGLSRGIQAEQPMFLYTPAAPQAGNNSGGLNMRGLLTIGVVIGVGYFLYKKFA